MTPPASPPFAGVLRLAGETWSTPAFVQTGCGSMLVAADRTGTIFGFTGDPAKELWRISVGAEITASPLVYNQKDGPPLIVIGDHAGIVHVINPSNGKIVVQIRTGAIIRATVAAADLDNDGVDELIVATYGPAIMVTKIDGTLLWRRPLPAHVFGDWMKRGIVSSPLVCDVDRDGELEIVLGVRSARLFCITGATGRIKWFSELDYDPDSSPSFCLTQDADPLVIIGGGEHTAGEGDNAVIALDGRNGRKVWSCPVGGGVDSSPMLRVRPGHASQVLACSLGYASVLAVCSDTGVLEWRHDFGPTETCWHAEDGRCRRQSSGRYFTEDAICRSYTTPLITDLDGDGRDEVVAGSNNGEIVCLDADSGRLRWHDFTNGMVRGSPILAQLNERGPVSLIVPSGAELRIYQTCCKDAGMPMFKGEADHLGGPRPAKAPINPRRPARLIGLRMFWRFVVVNALWHVALKLDEKVLQRLGLRAFRHGY